jgi:hypothetical protein
MIVVPGIWGSYAPPGPRRLDSSSTGWGDATPFRAKDDPDRV